MSDRKERFTAGPWVLTSRQSNWGTVMDIDGGPDGDWVARLGMTEESEVGRANAALLLAAPDMYSLLKEMLSSEYAQGTQFMAYYERAITNLLKKARGEEWNG